MRNLIRRGKKFFGVRDPAGYITLFSTDKLQDDMSERQKMRCKLTGPTTGSSIGTGTEMATLWGLTCFILCIAW